MTLHVLRSLNHLDACVTTARADDFILLVDQAANNAHSMNAVVKEIGCGVGVLVDDLDEGTLTEQFAGMRIIQVSDDDWVTLTERHSNQVSWS